MQLRGMTRAKRARRVLAKEPVMPRRWARARARMLCCTLLDCERNDTLLLVHLDNDHQGTCLMEFQRVWRSRDRAACTRRQVAWLVERALLPAVHSGMTARHDTRRHEPCKRGRNSIARAPSLQGAVAGKWKGRGAVEPLNMPRCEPIDIVQPWRAVACLLRPRPTVARPGRLLQRVGQPRPSWPG
jgi:hypothetical protein